MSFRDEVVKILEDIVVEAKGNKAEAARMMHLDQSATLHTWITGTRLCISNALDTALSAIGCHVVRDGMSADALAFARGAEGKAGVVDEEVEALKAKLKSNEAELAEYKMRCKILEELIFKVARGNLSASMPDGVESSNSLS